MEFKYNKENKRLTVYGNDSERDIQTIKKLIEEEKIPKEIGTIVYQRNRTSVVSMMIRGMYLENLLRPSAPDPAAPIVVRKDIKTILKQINETNLRQALFSGVLMYSMATRRFLLFTPRNRKDQVYLLGDNPLSESETPVDIVRRVAHDDIEFENSDRLDINPNWLVPLKTLEIDGTMYHSALLIVEREFRPKLSDKFTNSIWALPEAFNELRLHKSVTEVFDKDNNLRRLTKPGEENIDYDKLIEGILHSTAAAAADEDVKNTET